MYDDRPPEPAIGREHIAALATADDGIRHAPEPVWDESTRPTATAPRGGEDASYDAHGYATAAHLVDVHDHLRGELDAIRQLITLVLDGALEPGEARGRIHETTLARHAWNLGAYCARYCRFVTGHHTLEDQVLFPHLRSSEPALEPVLDRLEQEHHVIHEVIEAVDRAIVAFDLDRSRVEPLRTAMDVLTDALVSHLSYEERELVEPLARHGMFPS